MFSSTFWESTSAHLATHGYVALTPKDYSLIHVGKIETLSARFKQKARGSCRQTLAFVSALDIPDGKDVIAARLILAYSLPKTPTLSERIRRAGIADYLARSSKLLQLLDGFTVAPDPQDGFCIG